MNQYIEWGILLSIWSNAMGWKKKSNERFDVFDRFKAWILNVVHDWKRDRSLSELYLAEIICGRDAEREKNNQTAEKFFD